MTDPSRVTLADIAAAAKVSVKTVSLALRGDQSVSRETASRIQELAFRLGYVSRGSKRQIIGVVVPYIGHRVYNDLFGFLRREASSYDFTMLLAEGMVELERHTVQPWPDDDLGYEQCAQLLSRNLPLDAILAYSDAIAIGALRAIADKSTLTVPDNISMVGFDGLAISQYTIPRITSVGFPWYRVALAALEALIDVMEKPSMVQLVHSFAPELVPGESVATRTRMATLRPWP